MMILKFISYTINYRIEHLVTKDFMLVSLGKLKINTKTALN